MLLGPPPMRVMRKGWWIYHELTYVQAEAYHLQAAAALAGDSSINGMRQQAHHLREAEMNRNWAWRDRHGILDIFEAKGAGA